MYRDADALQHAAQTMCQRHRAAGLLRLHIEEQESRRTVRASGCRPTEVRVECCWSLRVKVAEAAVSDATRRLDWRVVYAMVRGTLPTSKSY